MDNVKRTINSILRTMVSFPYSIIKTLKKHPEEFYLSAACKTAKSKEMEASFRLIPISSKIFCHAELTLCSDSFAIVMQGPIRAEDDFTVETVKYYKKLYPNAGIIVSTWNDEKTETVEKVQAAGARVILCEKPITGGHLNINYQLKSSSEGIKEACHKGYRYIAKTRTDQRITRPYIFEHLINLIHQYPSGEQAKQKQRLVSLSMNYGNMFFPYFMSDFFYFGTAEEMSRLFSFPLDDRPPFHMPSNSSKREYSDRSYAPEVFIMKNYLKALGCSGDGTIKDYWEGVSKYLICVDMKMLDIYWPKYENKYLLHEFYGDYFERDSQSKLMTVNFDFINWLNLYSGSLQYVPKYEQYADVIFK